MVGEVVTAGAQLGAKAGSRAQGGVSARRGAGCPPARTLAAQDGGQDRARGTEKREFGAVFSFDHGSVLCSRQVWG